MAFKALLLFAFVFISAEGKDLFKKCAESDTACLKAATQSFLTNTYAGKSEWGVKPTDPLVIPSLDIDATKEGGLVFHYKNVNVQGFKNLQVVDSKLSLENGVETLKIQADISITADVEVELTKLQKSFKGPWTGSATVLGTLDYGVGVKNVEGKQYYVIGPETITSEVVGQPTVNVGKDLQAAVDNDEEAAKLKPEWESNFVTIRDKVLTSIANNGFATVVNNLRSLGNTFDKTVFIKGE